MVTRGAAQPADAIPSEERILRATIDGLTQLDPAALTIQQICRAAEVTAPTIYYHFGNKDGLLAAAVEQLVTDWLSMIDAAVSREGSLDQTLEQAIGAWEATITAPTRPIAVFAWATLLLAGTSEECRDALIQARDRALSMVTDVLAQYVDQVRAGDLASLVIDAVVAAALQYELDRDQAGLRARLDGLGRLVGAAAALATS